MQLDPEKNRILITGITSIHGWPIYQKLLSLFPQENILAIGSPKIKIPVSDHIHKVCITDQQKLSRLGALFHPTHVIHCGGVCDLDVCEADPKWAHQMNVGGIQTILTVFGKNCHITYVSSDLVFSGVTTPDGGYKEQNLPDPVSVVGKTYYQAEKEVSRRDNTCIVRLALPLGDSFDGGKGAVDWIDSRFKRGLPVKLFYDELRSCISCEELAQKVIALSLTKARGIYHCGGEKSISLHEIGQMVLKAGQYPEHLLIRASRLDDIGGPPRAGDVSLNSSKLNTYLQTQS